MNRQEYIELNISYWVFARIVPERQFWVKGYALSIVILIGYLKINFGMPIVRLELKRLDNIASGMRRKEGVLRVAHHLLRTKAGIA